MTFGLREFIFLGVLLAVPIASYKYVFEPRNEEIARARSEIEIKQARLDKLDEVLARIDDIGLAITAGEESIEMIEAKLPDEQDVEGILERISDIARRNDLTVATVETDDPVQAALYRELPLRLSVRGTFDGFYQFLLELEGLPRVTRVHQMELKRLGDPIRGSTQNYPPGSMQANFTLSIYFEPRE